MKMGERKEKKRSGRQRQRKGVFSVSTRDTIKDRETSMEMYKTFSG